MKGNLLALPMLLALSVAAHAQVSLPTQPAPTPDLPQIRPIAPPVEVLPYPLWMIVAAAVAAALLLGLLIWGLVHYLRSRPAPPPPTPRQQALAALELSLIHI